MTINDLSNGLGEVAGTPDGAYTVRFERWLAHSPERVWAALTDPDRARRWFAEMTMEPEVGGRVHIDFGEQGQASGVVLTWEPPVALEYTWNETGATSKVRWELAAEGGGTRLHLTHSGLSTDTPHEYGAGWHDFLDRLPAYLDDHDATTFPDRFDDLLLTYRERATS